KPTGNNAKFMNQNVPELEQGKTIPVSITMKNTGTTPWTKEGNFKLTNLSPSKKQWGVEHLSLAEGDSIQPGGEKTFTFDVTVPDYEGNFIFQWQMLQEAEEKFGEKSAIKQLVVGDPGRYLDDCDNITDWKSSQAIKVNSEEKMQGGGCIEFSGSSTDEYKKVFSPVYDSELTESNAVLKFWYYVSDPAVLSAQNQVEIGSAGKPDTDEFNWKLSGLTEGWNLVSFEVADAGKMGSPDLNAINWFRLYNKKTGAVTSRIDAMQIVNKETTNTSLPAPNPDKDLFHIYPNPLKGNWLSVDLNGVSSTKETEILITNLNGQVLYKKKTYDSKHLINTAGWPGNSTYLVSIRNDRFIKTRKLILQ
ncbi:MAG TPA: T9SS type A sorting domain-containing protein, partial [Bacteroidales bacterium]|nr:T9SS type A sorting domain-containing protein [Bacteroidales bacterium]